MRLIIFVKIPERVEAIPLDVIDNRPSQDVLNDILVLAKLSVKNSLITHYYLARSGIRLNPTQTLSQNGVNNGTLLDVVKSNSQDAPENNAQFVNIVFQENSIEINGETKSIKKTEKKIDKSNVPGKKIDFD